MVLNPSMYGVSGGRISQDGQIARPLFLAMVQVERPNSFDLVDLHNPSAPVRLKALGSRDDDDDVGWWMMFLKIMKVGVCVRLAVCC